MVQLGACKLYYPIASFIISQLNQLLPNEKIKFDAVAISLQARSSDVIVRK